MSTPMNWPPFLTFLTSQNLSSRPHPCLNSERPAFKSARRGKIQSVTLEDAMVDFIGDSGRNDAVGVDAVVGGLMSPTEDNYIRYRDELRSREM
ncbi:hypothetical protein F2Q70_00017617 [Brassica cretica]|uniref:Uncharacterized protein n=1 Tax=Brassica cretica TaxID=69181 RepID=A0A3N6SKH5_BRACR|nr:hypothetical protein F2Q70_00017617 [Brassica cretica]KAF2595756.1 hypothetical protein F2Q68_00010553 [Brassica cretica]KAF3538802.1 hypothetical protein F2Q69_00023277 [Brassica cretica]